MEQNEKRSAGTSLQSSKTSYGSIHKQYKDLLVLRDEIKQTLPGVMITPSTSSNIEGKRNYPCITVDCNMGKPVLF